MNLVFLHAEVVRTAGHVGQRTDKFMAAQKWWIQQHCTHFPHFLQTQKTGSLSISFFIVLCWIHGILDFSLQFISNYIPAGHERQLQHRVKRSQKAPWDIGPRVALLPPSYSQTFLCPASAHLEDRGREAFEKKPGVLK